MWPRLLELLPKLVDALPHIERFSSMADRYLSSKAASDAALVDMAESVRKDFAHVAAANADLSRQTGALDAHINDLAAQINTVGETAEHARSAATALGTSLVTMDREIRSLRSLLVAALVLLVLLVLMVGWLLLTRSS